MAVPNNDTFNFEDVTNEIYGDTAAGRNLNDAHNTTSGTDADINLYDPDYIGDQDTLYNFRNYGGGNLNLSATGGGCSSPFLYSVRSNNVNLPPAVGDIIEVYMGETGGASDTFVGTGDSYRFLYNGTDSEVVEIDSSGEITTIVTPC